MIWDSLLVVGCGYLPDLRSVERMVRATVFTCSPTKSDLLVTMFVVNDIRYRDMKYEMPN